MNRARAELPTFRRPTALRRLARALLSAAAILAGPAAAQTGAVDPMAVEEEARIASERAAAAEIVARRLAEEQEALSRRLAELGPSIVARETALEDARTRLRALNERMAAATARLRETSQELESLLRATQRAAREPTPSLLAHPDRAVAAARAAMLLRRLSRALGSAAARARSDLDAVAAAAAEVRGVEQAARTELAALRSEEAEVQSLLARKLRDRQRAAAGAREATRQAKRLSDRAQNLSELAAAIAAAPPAAAPSPIAPRPAPPKTEDDASRTPPPPLELESETDPEPSDPPGTAVAPEAPAAPDVFRLPDAPERPETPRPSAPAVAFASAKGQILRPAAGRLAKASSGAEGVDLLTRPYARVIAPWSGLVRYAGAFPNYGEIVIIEPERGWQILLTGLGAVDRDVGERVLAGEPIGRMGGPPQSSPEFLFEVSGETRAERERLYFEIRRRGRPIPSAPWLTTLRQEGETL
ncbi:MAG: peptidoglycan DD-metalloendopeptidase family protein [Pseudomonadota bacterium]